MDRCDVPFRRLLVLALMGDRPIVRKARERESVYVRVSEWLRG